MENIQGLKIDKLPFELNKRGDLISYEGPLLSHFYDENGNNYLLYWLDTDDDYNRWLLFQVSPVDLYDYFEIRQSLKNLINESEEIIYYLDIDSDVNFKNIIISNKVNIPSIYLPDEDSYYEEFIATNYCEILKDEIIKTYSKFNITNIKSKIKYFNNHLDDLDFISILNERNIKNTISELSQLKSSYLPLLILQQHLDTFQNDSLKHLLHVHNHAYTNPFQFDSYFHELDNILESKFKYNLKFNDYNDDYSRITNKLFSIAIDVISENPIKFKPQIILWKEISKNDKSQNSLDCMLNEILTF